MNSRRLYWPALIVILLLGAGLRLGNLDVVEFKRDEANLSQLALELARGRSFPLLGIVSSVGIPNSPVSAWLLAIPYALTSSPVLATGYVGLLNVVALALLALMVRRYYGMWASLLAALLYAVSPWALIYSRKIWAQDMLPPFIIGTVWLAVLVLVERKRRAGWLCLPLLAITAQIHYSAVLLVVPVLGVLLLHRSTVPRSFWLSAIPAALLCVPFLVGIVQGNLLDPARIQQVLDNRLDEASAEPGALVNPLAFQYTALTVSGTDIHSLAGPQVFEEYLASVPPLYPLFSLLTGVLVFGTGWLIWRSAHQRDQRRSVDVALLALLLTPMVVFSFNWTTVYPHYFILLMPAAFAIIAITIVDVGRAVQRWPQARLIYGGVAALVIGAVLTGQLLYRVRLTETLATRYTPDGFGTPLGRLMTIRQAILDESPDQVIAQVGGMSIGIDDGPSVWNFLLADVPLVRFVDERTSLLYTNGRAISLTASCVPGTVGLQFALREPTEGCYTVSDFPPQPELELPPAPYLSNGVRIHSAGWDAEATCVSLVWSIAQPTSVDYFFKVHLMDSSGQRVAVADGPAWSGRFWQPGDVVQSLYCAPDGVDRSAVAAVQLGMYTYDGATFGNVDVLDAAGNPAGQSIEVVLE
jgi:4-amino-4-deoxy-L-arabinose transferase-like glycosyltransferase